MSVYDHKAVFRTSEEISMSAFAGKVLLIVNTASKCGFTPQFKGLEWLNRRYRDEGLCVVGFPCNQFARQDPGSNTAINNFCTKNYGVTFPVFAKIEVNGKNEHPLYADLKKEARGVFWTKRIKWNFTKFLVDHEGQVLQRYAPTTEPSKLVADIEAALANIKD